MFLSYFIVQRWRGAPAERSEDRVPPRGWAYFKGFCGEIEH
jgi:hypothetical protein